MKRVFVGVVLSFVLVAGMGFVSRMQAEDLTGKWGVSGIAQAAFPLGQQSVKDQARDMGPDLGGMIRYGFAPHWGAGISYENIDLGHGIRVEPIDATLIHVCMPNKRWTPVEMLGLGVGRGVDTKIYNDLTAKAALGIEYFVMPNVAVGPQVAYHYISDTGTESRRHGHVLTAGLLASLFIGNASSPAPVKAEAPKPVPVQAPIALSLVPTQATMEAAKTQQFTANVTGTNNTGVTWSLDPATLGTLSSSGLYTAPSPIAFAEQVRVTAASVADASKYATAVVNLVPPANAAKKVSIELNVLFDTAKDLIKPEFSAEIQKVADFMKQYPHTQAEIEGHTDSVGSASYNEGLSQRRADAVRKALSSQFGIDSSRLTAKGYGGTRPVASNDSKEGRAKNRRVIATITGTN